MSSIPSGYRPVEGRYKPERNGALVAFENGRAGFYKNNKNVIKHDYEDIGYDINNNCLILQKDSKQGIADFEGNIIK